MPAHPHRLEMTAALASHTAKAGTRAVVNTSPEPFSNVAVSTGEDVVTGGLLFLALQQPELAIVVAIFVVVACVFGLLMVRRVLKTLFGSGADQVSTESEVAASRCARTRFPISKFPSKPDPP